MKTTFWTLLFFFGMLDIYSLLPPTPPFPESPPAPGLRFRQGIIHVHSVFSDGGGTVPEIALAARQAGMDFVVLTDHMTSRARKEGLEKNYDGVDLFVEMEASTPAGHALIFYSQTAARNLPDDVVNNLAYQHFLGRDTRPGIFVVTAHPSNLKIPWTALDRAPDGTEVINLDSVWRELADTSTLDFAATVALTPFNHFLAALRFMQVNPKDFLAWDTMNSFSKGHFGIVGQDTHANLKINRGWAIHWPDYRETFELASNIIFFKEPLSSDFETRKAELYTALHAGQSAITFPFVYPFRGNDWRLQCGTSIYRSGENPPAAASCEFQIEVPSSFPYPVQFRLVRNGELNIQLEGTPGKTTHVRLGSPGVYRLEVWADLHTRFHVLLSRPVPYIFYNPIYVR